MRKAQLTEEMLGLCFFLRRHTLCTFGEAAKAILPPGSLSPHENIRYRKTCELLIGAEEVGRLIGEGKGALSPVLHDAILALSALGFSEEAANKMVSQVVAAHPEAKDTEAVIRLALKG